MIGWPSYDSHLVLWPLEQLLRLPAISISRRGLELLQVPLSWHLLEVLSSSTVDSSFDNSVSLGIGITRNYDIMIGHYFPNTIESKNRNMDLTLTYVPVRTALCFER